MKAGANSNISFLISYMHTDRIIDRRMPINHTSSKTDQFNWTGS